MAQKHGDDTPATVVTTSPKSQPLQPPWIAEATLVLQVAAKTSIVQGLRDLIRVPRGRMGTYEACDFFQVLILYAVSLATTVKDFYPALLTWGPALAGLWMRLKLPARSTLSRFLIVVTLEATEALRKLLFDDLLAHGLRGELLGNLCDRAGIAHLLFDVDGTKQVARQRSLVEDEEHPPIWRRLAILCEKGYPGRKRGQLVRTRTVVQQAHTHELLGTWGAAGNGKAFEDLAQACSSVKRYMIEHGWAVTRGVLRLDGLYGVVQAVFIIATAGLGWLVRANDQRLWKRAEVRLAMAAPAQATVKQIDTGTEREVVDVGWLAWAAAKDPLQTVETRLVLARHTLRPGEKFKVGHLVDDVVYELFATDRRETGWHAVDVVDLYFARGGFEQTLSEEDQEQEPDRWVSGHPHGQECWQLLCQWVWNLRLRLGVAALAPEPRCTLWSEALPPPDNHEASEQLPATPAAPGPGGIAAAVEDPAPAPDSQAEEPVVEAIRLSALRAPSSAVPAAGDPPTEQHAEVPGQVAEAAGRGAGKYGGHDFHWTPSGELRCPAGTALRPQTRRLEGDNWRVIYVAPATACATCHQAPRCRGSGAKRRSGRRVSVFIPRKPSTLVTTQPFATPVPHNPASIPLAASLPPPCGSLPLLWTDVPATTLRRVLWVEVQGQSVDPIPAVLMPSRPRLSRAQRAHRRLSWVLRVARNAHSPHVQPWRLHLHGIPHGIASYLDDLPCPSVAA